LDEPGFNDADFYKTIQPREIGFISYPNSDALASSKTPLC
jgi:hypothetical protein